eukprot:m51a1_g9066 hypothetical protein (112) ;mRNA; f:88696-89031
MSKVVFELFTWKTAPEPTSSGALEIAVPRHHAPPYLAGFLCDAVARAMASTAPARRLAAGRGGRRPLGERPDRHRGGDLRCGRGRTLLRPVVALREMPDGSPAYRGLEKNT